VVFSILICELLISTFELDRQIGKVGTLCVHVSSLFEINIIIMLSKEACPSICEILLENYETLLKCMIFTSRQFPLFWYMVC